MVVRRISDRRRDELARKKQEAALGGGVRRIEAQHKRGKLTARERLNTLLDDDTFEELDSLMTHRTVAFGLEKQKFKLNVRKLKNLGLTESLGTGYRISPRGYVALGRIRVASVKG